MSKKEAPGSLLVSYSFEGSLSLFKCQEPSMNLYTSLFARYFSTASAAVMIAGKDDCVDDVVEKGDDVVTLVFIATDRFLKTEDDDGGAQDEARESARVREKCTVDVVEKNTDVATERILILPTLACTLSFQCLSLYDLKKCPTSVSSRYCYYYWYTLSS